MSEIEPRDACTTRITRLDAWSIRETASGERYIVGVDVERRNGWVSAQVIALNARTRVGETSGGQTYYLVGPAGYNLNAEDVWNGFILEMQFPGWRDITSELCPDWGNSVPEADRQQAQAPSTVARRDRRN